MEYGRKNVRRHFKSNCHATTEKKTKDSLLPPPPVDDPLVIILPLLPLQPYLLLTSLSEKIIPLRLKERLALRVEWGFYSKNLILLRDGADSLVCAAFNLVERWH
jgi:hypothetical protein